MLWCCYIYNWKHPHMLLYFIYAQLQKQNKKLLNQPQHLNLFKGEVTQILAKQISSKNKK